MNFFLISLKIRKTCVYTHRVGIHVRKKITLLLTNMAAMRKFGAKKLKLGTHYTRVYGPCSRAVSKASTRPVNTTCVIFDNRVLVNRGQGPCTRVVCTELKNQLKQSIAQSEISYRHHRHRWKEEFLTFALLVPCRYCRFAK